MLDFISRILFWMGIYKIIISIITLIEYIIYILNGYHKKMDINESEDNIIFYVNNDNKYFIVDYYKYFYDINMIRIKEEFIDKIDYLTENNRININKIIYKNYHNYLYIILCDKNEEINMKNIIDNTILEVVKYLNNIDNNQLDKDSYLKLEYEYDIDESKIKTVYIERIDYNKINDDYYFDQFDIYHVYKLDDDDIKYDSYYLIEYNSDDKEETETIKNIYDDRYKLQLSIEYMNDKNSNYLKIDDHDYYLNYTSIDKLSDILVIYFESS